MSRIAKVDPKDWDAELRTLVRPETATPLEQGLMRMFAHRPPLAKGLAAFAGALRAHRTLSDRLVELVRLRVAFHNQCRSCMAIRYRDAVNDGVSEALVCSLEKPAEAADLTDAEKAALAYADAFATDHLAVDDATFARLRAHFSEAHIVELGMTIAFFVGFGRLAATWDMVEELPPSFQDHERRLTPWGEESIVVR
jgi:AhpD family alkylhydroperoxidase